MCSIAGCSVHPDDNIDAHKLAVALLIEGQSRGTDATGAAWFDGNAELWSQKDHMSAKDWTPHCAVPSDARTVILHTRWATQGSKYDNNNNHPLIVDTGQGEGICGVHNGQVWNDDRLYAKMDVKDRRVAEVDSEAIFAAIAYGQELNEDGKPRLASTLEGVLGEIAGSAAIGWIELGGDPHLLHVARLSSSPFFWGQTAKGSFVFASTKEMLERACDKADVKLDTIGSLDEGEYLRVYAGIITDRRKFRPYTWGSSTYLPHGMDWYDDEEYAYYAGRLGAPTATEQKALPTMSTTTTVTKETDDGAVSEYVEVDDEAGRIKTYDYRNGGFVLVSDEPLIKSHTGKAVITAEEAAEDEEIIAEMMETDSSPNFKPLLFPESLHEHVRHVLLNDPDYVDGVRQLTAYPSRQKAINDYVNTLGDTDAASIGDQLQDLGAFLCQGDLVVSDLGHLQNLSGQIVSLPPTFPNGEYLIKLLVPNKRYRSGFEQIIVSRRLNEFILDSTYEDRKASA